MIQSRRDLYEYMAADKKALNRRKENWLKEFVLRLFNWEKILVEDYLVLLRKVEYLHNRKKNPFHYLRYAWIYYKYRRRCIKLLINIPPNVAGPGLAIYHLGPITINKLVRIGSNCTLQPGVVIGQNRTEDNVPVIGNDVYFSPGAKAFGKIRIGNNVIVAPNSVVTKDIPDNCVVSGVPARIIIMNGEKVN